MEQQQPEGFVPSGPTGQFNVEQQQYLEGQPPANGEQWGQAGQDGNVGGQQQFPPQDQFGQQQQNYNNPTEQQYYDQQQQQYYDQQQQQYYDQQQQYYYDQQQQQQYYNQQQQPPAEQDYNVAGQPDTDQSDQNQYNESEEQQQHYYEQYEEQNSEQYYGETEQSEPQVETLFTSQSYQEQQQDTYENVPEYTDQLDGEQYLEYVKQMMEEQGYDYDQWMQQVMQQNQGNPDYWGPPNTDTDYYDTNQIENDEYEEPEQEQVFDPASHDIDYSSPKKPPPKKLMGMKSFRYLETRVLSNFIKDSEDERMNKIKARLGFMKNVKPPVVDKSLNVLLEKPEYKESPSNDELNAEMEHMKEYTEREWALKHVVSFLQKSGCRSPENSWTDFKIPEKEMTVQLKEFLRKGGVGEKRRVGIGDAVAAPQIDDPMKRRAGRAVWRFIIDNARPRYPLPRFILPRFQHLRKIEAELIGPGSYEHNYFENQRLKRLRRSPSLFRSCSSRFPKEKLAFPAAAFITEPHSAWDAACDRHKHPGTVPLFQSTPCNFRYKNFYMGCGLPPGHYNIKSPLEEFLKTNKSLRGMYTTGSGTDAFCAKECREYSTSTKGSQSPFAARRGPGAYDIGQTLSELQANKCNCFKGKFSKTPRNKMFGFRAAYNNPLWPEDKGFPGPATYNPYETEEWIQSSWAPFEVAVKGRKLDNESSNKLLSPDFYFYRDTTIPEKTDIIGDGMRSNFKSKSSQITPHALHVVMRERNKPKNPKFDQANFYKKKSTDPCDT